ncbi:hypothetical protein Efla_001910 [Eimeria flavescens]
MRINGSADFCCLWALLLCKPFAFRDACPSSFRSPLHFSSSQLSSSPLPACRSPPLPAARKHSGECLEAAGTAAAVKEPSFVSLLKWEAQKGTTEGLPSAAVGSETTRVSMHRLLRLRRRNLRFLCRSRHNRQRGLLRPAAAAAAEAAAAQKDSAEDAFVRDSLQQEDPLVAQLAERRWRTQWFPSFARRALVPLTLAARHCDVIVEVRDARLPLLSSCNLRLLKRRTIPKAVVFTHADQQASPAATRLWQRHFRRLSREAAALELHAELSKASTLLANRGLLRALAERCPLPLRVPHLFIDAREPAAVVRLQRLLRSLVRRHRLHRQQLLYFRSSCKRLALAAAAGGGGGGGAAAAAGAAAEEAKAAEAAVAAGALHALGATAGSAAASSGVEQQGLSRALVQQRKPIRVLILGAPNVGKSRVANCLLGRKAALSYRWPGVTRSVNTYRHHPSSRGAEDASRLFDVVDSPGFVSVHPSERVKRQRQPSVHEQQRLQQLLGTAAGSRQLPLELFFDFQQPRLSADQLGLLAALRLLPESALFTIEEAAVALANAFFSIREQMPAAAADFQKLVDRYSLDLRAFDEKGNLGVQLLIQLADQRHHSNTGAAAQRLLSDLTQGYLGRHSFELPAGRRWDSAAAAADKQQQADRLEAPAEPIQRLLECLDRQRPRSSSMSNSQSADCACSSVSEPRGEAQALEQQQQPERRWTLRRRGQRLSFVLPAAGSLSKKGGARHSETVADAAFGRGAAAAAGDPGELLPSNSREERRPKLPRVLQAAEENTREEQLFRGCLEGW